MVQDFFHLNNKRECITCGKRYFPTSPMQKYCCREHNPNYKEPNDYYIKKNQIFRSLNKWDILHPKYTEDMIINSINNYFKSKELDIPLSILSKHPYFKACNKRPYSKFKNYAHYIKFCQRVALNKIKIPDNQLCELCNLNLAKVRHHPEYIKPLYVQFLCKSCHAKLHQSI